MELVNNGTEVGSPLDQSAASPAAQAATANMSWAPVATPTDLAGNTATTTARAETDNDRDF